MVSIFYVIARPNLVHQNGGPAILLKREVGIYPAFTQVLVEGTELMIKVILSADRPDNFLDQDLLYTQEFSVGAFSGASSGKIARFVVIPSSFAQSASRRAFVRSVKNLWDR
jgi:hypothetical protein